MTVHGSWTVDSLVDEYTHHQRRTRGLRPQTLRNRAWFARKLVRAALGTDPIDPSRLTPAAVVAFITSLSHRRGPTAMSSALSSLRSFFRFLRVEGFCGDALEAALPTVAPLAACDAPSFPDRATARASARVVRPVPPRAGNETRQSCSAWRPLGAAAPARSPTCVWTTSTGAAAPCRYAPARTVEAPCCRCPRVVGQALVAYLSGGASGDRRTPGVRRAPGRSSRQAALERARLTCRDTRGSPGGSRRAAHRRLRLPAHGSQPHGASGSQPQGGR